MLVLRSFAMKLLTFHRHESHKGAALHVPKQSKRQTLPQCLIATRDLHAFHHFFVSYLFSQIKWSCLGAGVIAALSHSAIVIKSV
ncbi:hypothetical protein GJ744_001623 [Endocarpon pusillum]|uniref:Uncharacterized protein n=1 Tax=Endocarpon pusillum TaxID=364733 RepID=A0A8H7ABY9_9EURO|nr:hypothetical protein GJ744_001623 [Endocarpon pusillum]